VNIKICRCVNDDEANGLDVPVLDSRNRVVEVTGLANKVKAIIELLKGRGEITVWEKESSDV
jgi:hypothetical protein